MTTRRNVIAMTAVALSVAACDILTVVGDIDGTTTGASSTSSGGTGGGYDGVLLIGFSPGWEVSDPLQAIGAYSCWMNNGTGVQIVGESASLAYADNTQQLVALGGALDASQRRGPLTLTHAATPLVWSLPLTPTGISLESVIDGGPEGQSDTYFTTEAQNLKDYGFSNVIWRVGWESDQSHWPWAAYYQAKNASDVAKRSKLFAAAYQRAVEKIREVDDHARFEYASGVTQNPIGDSGAYFDANDPSAAYPGDEYVDFIGTESAPNDYGSYDFKHQMKAPPEEMLDAALASLETMKAFARSRRKPFVVSQWGVSLNADGHGTDDSALVMKGLLEWLNRNCYYHLYFNSSDFAFNATTVKIEAHEGDTTLVVVDAGAFAQPAHGGIGFLRYSTDGGKTLRQIQYRGLDKARNLVTEIPKAGFGSIPVGGIPKDAKIVEAISRLSQLAIGEDDDIGEAKPGYRTNPSFAEAGAAYLEVLNPEAGVPCE